MEYNLNTDTADAPAGPAPAANPFPTADGPVTSSPAPVSTPEQDASEGGEGGKGDNTASPPLPPSPPAATQAAEAHRPGARGDDVYRPAPAANPVLAALRKAGLYRAQVDDDHHSITCPWSSEHATGDEDGAIYASPTVSAPYGSFRCDGRHLALRTIGSFLDQLGVDRMDARGKPRISVVEGEPHRVAAACELVLSERGDLYRAGGPITQVRVDQASGDVTTEALTEQSLFMHLSTAADFRKFDARTEQWRRCDVPQRVVATVLKSHSLSHLPNLKGLARQPFFRREDGALVTTPGYDPVSGVYAAFDPAAFNLPEPTRENALAALARLKALLSEFEFATDADRAGALCAMLTGTIRSYLPLAPAFNITASSPGSGKSYLASVIAPFAGPGQPRNISYPTTAEEASKVVLSIAMEKPAVVLFDDMNGDWHPHGALNRMLTSGSVSERMLGTNRVVTAPATSLVIGTGNNIRPLRDMGRRVLSIYLLPKTEAAAMREFIGRPDGEVRRNRARYVGDALTIVRAFDVGGRRLANVPNIAGFEEWSERCRHSLIYLGEPDPASSLIQQIAHDPDAELLADLLRAWIDAFGERATLVRQVLGYMERHEQGDLADAVKELPCIDSGRVNQSKFGRYLARQKNRIVDGLQLVEAPHSERRAWAVKRVGHPMDAPAKSIFEEPEPTLERAWTVPLESR